MSQEEFTQRIQIIRQQIEALQRYIHTISKPIQQQHVTEAIEEITSSLGNLQLLQEENQTSLELMEVIQEELRLQNEYLAVECQSYYDMFQFAPDAYLLTNEQGIILKANHSAAELLNVLPQFLISLPLANFVAQAERSVFRTKLNQLSQINSVQEWEIPMCRHEGEPFDASLLVVPNRDFSEKLVSVRISIRDMTKYKQADLQQLQSACTQLLPEVTAVLETPLALDGLQVLFVDDEADAREFITVVLEQQGISVTAVSSVAEALSVLERVRPDVLISDIRMAIEDGYALIEKVRAIEREFGWQIPTAALTAYLAEEQAKAIEAGFQAHLHKLAQPTELVAMVAQLAKRSKLPTPTA
ncbi:MAG: response regulator [Rhizonema sp. NSF051]|nr:response regulator [Rhizonema sp. NSF051]